MAGKTCAMCIGILLLAFWAKPALAGLTHEWAFNETSGTIAFDSAVPSLNGTANAGVSVNQPGRIGTGYWFDGSTGQVVVPNDASLNTAGTWSVWINTAAWGGGKYYMLLDKRGTAGGVLALDPSGHVFAQAFGGISLSGSSFVADGQWHHVAFTFGATAGSIQKIYVDGKLDGSATAGAALSFDTRPLEIGVSHDGFWGKFKGTMDDLSVWNESLAPGKIRGMNAILNVNAGALADYGAGRMAQLFNVYDGAFATASLGSLTWTKALGLTGHAVGDAWFEGGSYYLQLGADDGVMTMATADWTGGGADGNWQTEGNWQGGSKPAAKSILNFAGTTNLNTVNDFAPDTEFNGIVFGPTAGAFTLGGANRVLLAGGIVNNSLTDTQTISLPIALAASSIAISAGSHGVALGGNIDDAGAGHGINAVSGVLALSGSNTFTGALTINAATVVASAPVNLGDGPLGISGGTLRFSAPFDPSTKADTSARGVTLGTAGGTLDTNEHDVSVANPIDGPGVLIKAGAGTLTLEAANTFEGGLSITGGVVRVDNDSALNPVSGNGVGFGAANSGTLQLNGHSLGIPSLNGSVPGPIVENGAASDAALTLGTAGNSSYAGVLRDGGAGKLALIKSGPGMFALTGASNDFTGDTTIEGGALDLGSGLAARSAASNLVLADWFGNTAVIQGNGLYVAGIGAGADNVRWTGSGGFAARGGALTVNLNNSSAPLAWEDPDFIPRFSSLVLGSPTADSAVNVQNNLDLAGDDRTVYVQDNPGGTADHAVISGVLSNSNEFAPARLVKAGPGTLKLTAAAPLAYSGGVVIDAGTLELAPSADYAYHDPITGAGSLAKTGPSKLTLTGMTSINGALTVNGGTLELPAGSAVTVGAYSFVGYAGAAAMTISEGSLTINAPFGAAFLAGSDSTIVQNGGLVKFNGPTYLGHAGAGSYTLNAGVIDAAGQELWPSTHGSGTMTINDGMITAASFHVGEYDALGSTVNIHGGSIDIANAFRTRGACNMVNQTGGTVTAANAFLADYDTAGQSVYNLSGGVLDVANMLCVATHAGSTMNVSGGTVNARGTVYVKYDNLRHAGAGTLNISGGEFNVIGAGGITTNAAGVPAVLNLSGGLLDMQGHNIVNLTAFNFSGGMLKNPGAVASTPLVSGPATLWVDAGHTAAFNGTDFTRGGRGTLVIASDGEVLFNNLGVSNGMTAPWIIMRTSTTDSTGDFTNNLAGGIVPAVCDLDDTFDTATSAAKVKIATAKTIDDAAAYALRNDSVIAINDGMTLALGNTAFSAQAGLVLNGGEIRGGTLAFAPGTEGLVYASDAGGTITSALSGDGGLTKFGPGALALSGDNFALSGAMTVNGGTLHVDSLRSLGNGATLALNGAALRLGSAFDPTTARAITLNVGGGTLDTNDHDITVANRITGIGRLTKAGAGTLTLTGPHTYSGGTIVETGTLQFGDGASANGSVSGDIVNHSVVAFANPADQIYLGSISGSGSLTKTGAGTLVIGRAQSYQGPTVISGGTLQLPRVSLPDGVVALYDFADGTAGDSSGQGNHATLVGGPGIAHGVLSLSGSGQYLSLPNMSDRFADSATLSLWMKLADATPTQNGRTGFSTLSSSPAASHYPWVNGMAYSTTFRSTREEAIALSDAIDRSQWHLVTITSDPLGGWNFYQNGELLRHDDQGAFAISGWTIGMSPAGFFTSGAVGGVLLANRAFTPEEIAAIYNAGFNIDGNDLLPAGTALTIAKDAGLNLNGVNQTVGSLAGEAGSEIQLGGAVLTAGGDDRSSEFAGQISGEGMLVKRGAGVLMLSGVNRHTGGTRVEQGELHVSAVTALPAGGALTIGAEGAVVLASGISAAGAVGATAVPEPSTLLLGITALCGLAVWHRRRG